MEMQCFFETLDDLNERKDGFIAAFVCICGGISSEVQRDKCVFEKDVTKKTEKFNSFPRNMKRQQEKCGFHRIHRDFRGISPKIVTLHLEQPSALRLAHGQSLWIARMTSAEVFAAGLNLLILQLF